MKSIKATQGLFFDSAANSSEIRIKLHGSNHRPRLASCLKRWRSLRLCLIWRVARSLKVKRFIFRLVSSLKSEPEDILCVCVCVWKCMLLKCELLLLSNNFLEFFLSVRSFQIFFFFLFIFQQRLQTFQSFQRIIIIESAAL